MLFDQWAIDTDDQKFLFAAYSSTHWDEMRLVDGNSHQIQTFLQIQPKPTRLYHTDNNLGSKFQVILPDLQSVGPFHIDRVQQVHPALRSCERLSFHSAQEEGVFMKRPPAFVEQLEHIG